MEKMINYILALCALLIISSCANKPQGDKAAANKAREAGMIEGAEIFKVDIEKSVINWTGSKPTGKHNGTVNLKEGTLNVKEDRLVGGIIVIDLNSLANIDLEDQEMKAKLEGHLKSPDFFDVAKYPIATFEITEVKQKEEDTSALKMGEVITNCVITGNLAMKDSVKSISFEARVDIGKNLIYAETNSFIIDRTSWGVNYGSKKIFDNLKDKFIDDEIALILEISANIDVEGEN